MKIEDVKVGELVQDIQSIRELYHPNSVDFSDIGLVISTVTIDNTTNWPDSVNVFWFGANRIKFCIVRNLEYIS